LAPAVAAHASLSCTGERQPPAHSARETPAPRCPSPSAPTFAATTAPLASLDPAAAPHRTPPEHPGLPRSAAPLHSDTAAPAVPSPDPTAARIPPHAHVRQSA